jgi:predicted  nucleic acid-binding Zn-ribbon protein
MNDIKFLEKYNEAAIDNFLAVVKQNILFQAQVTYLSETNNMIPELKKQIADFEKVKDDYVRLQEENVNLKNELNTKISIIDGANKSDAEKFRLQTAMNTQLRDNELLKQASLKLQDKVNELTEHIAKLEEILPKSDAEKFRLQTAMNNQLRDNEALKQSSLKLQDKVNELTEHIAKLEEMLPKSARKKLNLPILGETSPEEKVDNDVQQTLSSGGNF